MIVEPAKVRRWIILFRGFTQREGAFTGLEKLYYRIKNVAGNGAVEVILNSWTADERELADRIFNNSVDVPDVTIIGYSWGGQTAVNLSSALQRRGVQVDWLFLCDAVYRARHPWQYARTILFPWLSIVVPSNVNRLWYCKPAELRGTGDRFWRGLAPGTRRDAGYFWIGCAGARSIVLCESAIDAISCFQLQPCGECICISTAGVRATAPWLYPLLSRGYQIHCGFDADEPGERASQRMIIRQPSVHRLRPPHHDWNDALRSH